VTQYAFGHVLRINSGSGVSYRYQNFFIQGAVSYEGSDYIFAPFGFSGVTVNRNGDGLEATVVFPNNDVARSWAVEAIDQYWVMEVDVLIIDETNTNGPHQSVHTYTGQVTGGQWDNVTVSLQLTSVLDAVGTDVPRRSLTRKLIGNLPISSNVRLQ